MDVVPAFLVVDEVKFPLVVDGGHVRLADDPRFPGLGALSYVVGHLSGRASDARVTELAARQSLRHQALTAMFIDPDDRDDLGGAVENWTRLAGRSPELDDAYLVGTSWIRDSLVVPRTTLIQLVERVGALIDAVEAHQLEARITGVPEAGPVSPLSQVDDQDLDREDALRDIEAVAAEVDALDLAAREGEAPYSNVERSAAAAARRHRLFLELEVAGLLEPTLTDEVRAALSRLGLTRTLGYHDAAQALAQYLASSERAARFPGEPVPTVTAARVSLDWFRTPSNYRPDGVTEHEWLALCEQNFMSPPPSSSSGRRFVRLCGAMQELLYRAEVGPTPCLWRAVRAA